MGLSAKLSAKLVVAKNPFFNLTYYIYFFQFFINLKKKVGFWPIRAFLTYLRKILWPFLLNFLATKWVFGHFFHKNCEKFVKSRETVKIKVGRIQKNGQKEKALKCDFRAFSNYSIPNSPNLHKRKTNAKPTKPISNPRFSSSRRSCLLV